MSRFNRLAHQLTAKVTQPLPDLTRPWEEVSIIAKEGVKEGNLILDKVVASHDRNVKERNETRRTRIASREQTFSNVIDKGSSLAKGGLAAIGGVELVALAVVGLIGYTVIKNPKRIALL